MEFDTKRAAEHGIDLKVALGIHPTNTNINPDNIFENLYKWIENKQIVAIGEIGLENLTDNEINKSFCLTLPKTNDCLEYNESIKLN